MATYQNENLGWHAPAYSEAHLQDFLEHRTREQLSHLAGLVAAEQARRAREVIKQGIERQREGEGAATRDTTRTTACTHRRRRSTISP